MSDPRPPEPPAGWPAPVEPGPGAVPPGWGAPDPAPTPGDPTAPFSGAIGPDPAGPGGTDGPPPSDPPPAAGAPKGRRWGRVALGAIGLAGIVGGGAFAYTQLTGGEKANTPVEAVRDFYRSIEEGDVLGMAATLAPGERDVMLDSMVPMFEELSRLEILEKDLDLEAVPGSRRRSRSSRRRRSCCATTSPRST